MAPIERDERFSLASESLQESFLPEAVDETALVGEAEAPPYSR
jgi:hypothetical protein